jgi:hypothetical protein
MFVPDGQLESAVRRHRSHTGGYRMAIHHIFRTVHSPVLAVLCCIAVTVPVFGYELARDEIANVPSWSVSLINHTGILREHDTPAQIRGIGTRLARGVLTDGKGTHDGRYSAHRYLSDTDGSKLAADIIVLGPGVLVRHSENLRLIVAGYLETAWGLAPADAERWALQVLVYNVELRGDAEYVNRRYRREVAEAVPAEMIGLSPDYREWPGGSNIIIPFRESAISDGVFGDHGLVDTSAAVDIEALVQRLESAIASREITGERIEMPSPVQSTGRHTPIPVADGLVAVVTGLDPGSYSLRLFNAQSGTWRSGPGVPVITRSVAVLGSGLLAGEASSGSLAVVGPSLEDVVVRSEESLTPDAPIFVDGDVVYTMIEHQGTIRLAVYDMQLRLLRRSPFPVLPEGGITVAGASLIVLDQDGNPRIVSR